MKVIATWFAIEENICCYGCECDDDSCCYDDIEFYCNGAVIIVLWTVIVMANLIL